MPHDALHRLLDRSLLLPDEYGGGLTSHLPMALHALQRLGADALQLQRFFDVYAARFGPREPSTAPVPALTDWLPHRGRYASLPMLQATFAQELQRDEPATVLRRTVPHLMPGVGAAAFHGLLRTAHAFEAGHLGELAHGLAYWAARWFALAPAPVTPCGFDDWSARLMRASAGVRISGELIVVRMQEAARTAAYRELAGSLAWQDDSLAQVAGFAAGLYAETGNFTVLHMVTGCRAARVMLPFAGEADASAALVRALTAACLASNVGEARRSPPEPIDRGSIVAAALASDDDHVIKLVDACLEETSVYGDPRHRRAATCALRRQPG